MRRGSWFSLAALPGVVGFWLILWGWQAGTGQHVRAGLLWLCGALAALGLVLYLRRQGWIN
jgi:hypothetical protein